MKQNERKLFISLLHRVEQKSPREAVEYMWQSGLVNRKAIERIYINSEVSRRVRLGESKCKAIEQVSKEMECSFEKVRAAVYSKQPEKVN